MARVETIHRRPDFTQVKEAISRRVTDTMLGYSQEQTGIIERRPIQHTIVDFLGARLTKEVEVQGTETLDTIRELLDEGKRVLYVPNHLAHMDAAAVDQSMDVTGNRDLADRLVFALGIRLERGTFSKPVVRSQNIIRTWPHTETPQTPQDEALQRLLSKSMPEDITSALDGGWTPVIFAQGTRAQEDQVMLPARNAVIKILDDSNVDYVVPVVLKGTQNILPKGGRPQRGAYGVTYCEPIDYHALQEVHRDKKHKLYREAMMDAIMVPIAREHPPEQRGPYASKV